MSKKLLCAAVCSAALTKMDYFVEGVAGKVSGK